MKTLIATLFLCTTFAMPALALRHKIDARHEGISFAALTGDQEISLSEKEKLALLQVRANDICRFIFGEAVALEVGRLAPAKGEVLIISDEGELVKTSIAQTNSPGYLGAHITGGTDINQGLIFTEITCNN